MTVMDVKGISWVGNMHQRFEELCQEVDETIYEDTVNYIGNQMKTVKETVKNFYSEVMQDLVDSSPNSAKEKYAQVTVAHNGDAVICKKPQFHNGSNSESVIAASKQITKESDVAVNVDKSLNLGLFHSAEVQCSENSESQFSKLVSNQSTTVDNYFNCRQELDPQLKSLADCSSNDFVEECSDSNSQYERVESLCGCRESGDSSSNIASAVKVSQSIENEEEVPGNIMEGYASTSVAKGSQWKRPSVGAVSTHLDDTVTSMEAVVGTTITDTNAVEADNELYVSDTDKQGCLEHLELEEPCVLGEMDDPFSKSTFADVQRFYKKKIRAAFSRRTWSEKSLLYTSTRHSKMENLETSEILESDWELL